MDIVSIAELKSRLSHYLREVRAGRSFTITSRDIPVATLEPLELQETDDLEVVEPAVDAVPLFEHVLDPTAGLPDGAELIRRDREASDARLDASVRETPGRRGQDEADGDS